MNENKTRIIEKALELFIEHGFNGVSLSDIQHACGISKGAFYYYFTSKEECFGDCVRRFLSEVRGGTNNSKTSAETLKDFIAEESDKMQARTNNYMFMDRISFFNEARKIMPDFMEYTNAVSKKESKIWETIIEKAIKNGEISEQCRTEETAKLFIYYADGALLNASISANMKTFCTEVKKGWENIYNMLCK